MLNIPLYMLFVLGKELETEVTTQHPYRKLLVNKA